MKRLLILLLLPSFCGCAYLHDRGRDACDMVTLSVEATGLNASLQVGPAVLGAGIASGKGFGLRSGAVGTYEFAEINLGIFGGKMLVPNDRDLDRDKGYGSFYRWFPWEDDDDENEFEMEIKEGKWFNSCQIECAAIAGVGARAGINVAEILDFILGWTTLDICGDDIGIMDKKERENVGKCKESDNKPDARDGL